MIFQGADAPPANDEYRRGNCVMSSSVSLFAVVHGHVQGVYFRAFVREKAVELGLNGYVRNLPSGRDVEVQVEGEREQLEALLGHLKKGPSMALVEEVKTTWSKSSGKYCSFVIR
jgi:acylphosphatase